MTALPIISLCAQRVVRLATIIWAMTVSENHCRHNHICFIAFANPVRGTTGIMTRSFARGCGLLSCLPRQCIYLLWVTIGFQATSLLAETRVRFVVSSRDFSDVPPDAVSNASTWLTCALRR